MLCVPSGIFFMSMPAVPQGHCASVLRWKAMQLRRHPVVYAGAVEGHTGRHRATVIPWQHTPGQLGCRDTCRNPDTPFSDAHLYGRFFSGYHRPPARPPPPGAHAYIFISRSCTGKPRPSCACAGWEHPLDESEEQRREQKKGHHAEQDECMDGDEHGEDAPGSSRRTRISTTAGCRRQAAGKKIWNFF